MKRKALLVLGIMGVAALVGCIVPWNGSGQILQLHGLVEIQEVRLGSKVGGRVKAVHVKEGETVEAGKLLVELEAPELEAQRDQLLARIDQAMAAYERAYHGPRAEEKEVALAAKNAAEARWRKLQAGFRVEEKEQARGDWESAVAESQRAQQDLERARALLSRAVSRAEFDAAAATYGRVQGQVKSAKARLDLYEAGSRVEELAEAEAEFAKAKANHDLLEAGTRAEDIAEAQARVDELKAKLREVSANLKEAALIAPERVVVEVVSVRPGDVASPNQPLVRVLRAADLWVKAYVPEIEMGKIRLNQSVEVAVDAYPNKRLAGKVVQIAAISEFTPRNVQSYDERRHQVFALKIHVEDPQGVCKSGMAAEVYLPLHDFDK